MQRPDPDSPPTFDDALRIARDLTREPDTLIPYPHEALENARHGRGFAFLDKVGNNPGYVLVTATGHASGMLSIDGRPLGTIDTVIAGHLARAEHVNRTIPDSELSTPQHLALRAYDAGLTRIGELPGGAAIDAPTADYAQYILIVLRNSGNRALSGRKILAHHDSLLRAPVAGRRYTHPCPHCDRPTTHQERYRRSVCGACFERTTDRAGRRVTGYNVSLSGGMIAYYTDTLDPGATREECVEVTRTGICYIDGQPAIMDEARFGGIVVEMGDGDDAHPHRSSV
ncbi:hypothetical protein [Nocardia sp. alder85J]|uniref:hypothetical protein n=1 Tax=Nocardia sp. alder85J TaxID=2862949 RepID=UPI001CD4E60D|nr:hypothetical protein [Nocardia sp. alder85J]MCX4091418.1 hypothetical protein [Nocardia sp. alder85J]